MREALCFGWIDSTPRPLADEKSALRFTPRRPGGTWSRSNKERVESLTAAGLMTAVGQEVIDAAKRDGSWSTLDAIEKLLAPDDLEQALAAYPDAQRNFDAFTPSARKHSLWWIESAKRPQTRAKRVAATVLLVARNATVTSLLLSVYAAIQGARAVRVPETRHLLESILATGWSRLAVIRDRATGDILTLALISLGVGIGLGASMAAADRPNFAGSLITLAAAGFCALAAHALGLLISQLTATTRPAGGIAAAVITGLYIFTTIWDKTGPPQELRHRQCRLATGTQVSPRNRDLTQPAW